MKTCNILFLGGAKRVSLANHFIKAGKKTGLDVHIFSYELDKRVPIASVGEVLIGKKWKDTDLIDDLCKIIIENNINIILPFVDPAVEKCGILKEKLPKVFIPSCDVNLCYVMFDKRESEKWFMDHDIPLPMSYHAGDKFDYPIIIKPRTGSASKGIVVISNDEEWHDVANKDNFVIQQYIVNHKEYSVDCYVNQKGKIISIVPRERLAVAGGEVVNSITVDDKDLVEVSKKILANKGFYGPVTIQFIKDVDNGYTYVMEINPRLGGGVVTSIGAGANITEFILTEYEGHILEPCTTWKPGIYMARYFNEVIFSCN